MVESRVNLNHFSPSHLPTHEKANGELPILTVRELRARRCGTLAGIADGSVSFSDVLITNQSIIHRAVKSFGQSCTLITLRAEEFVLTSVNSVVIAELVVMFLEGLKKRSRFAVAMHEKKSQGKSYNFTTG